MDVKISLRICCSFMLFLLVAATAFAQAGTGGINGVVTDPTGAAVPGTVVAVESKATGVVLKKTSNGTGVYSFTSLPPASYKMTFSRDGFETSVYDNIIVTVDQMTTLNASMKVGSASQTVTVTETSSLVETSMGNLLLWSWAKLWKAIPICCSRFSQAMRLARALLAVSAGNSRAARMPMMPMTTSISIRVNASFERQLFREFMPCLLAPRVPC